ncbi:AAA family ATPase [Halococcus sp. PRR34]|uniref:AAA family ATPase n=1 Tax=Halococcus sp. PRR34 TaxID=3020830 RepID=UPI00235F027F|nr:AAA family ATPase [Halococcus sp. PRR34]
MQRLSLTNFRQFTDDSIEFAHGEGANVTVVHGSNGSGKTTLLNAFTWALYDAVDFDTRPERLATEGAMAAANPGEKIEVSVTLEFEHEGRDYTVTRTAMFRKRSNDDFNGEIEDSDVVVEYREDGRATKVENERTALNNIIPQRLSELFFFDGEDIDELAGVDNQDRIQEAIQNIMGLTILERATRHLDHVAGEFEDEYAKYGSDELRELVQQKRDLEGEIDNLERKRKDKQREEERFAEEVRDIEQKLSGFDDSSRLQNQRKEYREREKQLKADIDNITERIRDEINDKGYAPVSMPLIRETAEELDQLRQNGVIPSDLTDDFLDSLLENKQCICGRPLESASDEYQTIESSKGDAPAEGVEQAALMIIGQLSQFSDDRSAFTERLEQHIQERNEKQQEIDKLLEYIDDISTELGEINDAIEGSKSIAEWEAERDRKSQAKDDAIREGSRLKEKIENKEEEIGNLEEEINDLREDRQEAQLARRRQRAAELVSGEIEEKFEDLKQRVRQLSNQTVSGTFGSVASKDLHAEITKEFRLKIYQDLPDRRVEVEKSTGERQIASLAFIGSLVKIARQRYESDGNSEYFTGGIYPLVMDSPFGALDKSHRREISRILPTLASQVVVFATDSQWEGPVEEEMSDVVGKHYRFDFDPGTGSGEYPCTRIKQEQTPTTY